MKSVLLITAAIVLSTLDIPVRDESRGFYLTKTKVNRFIHEAVNTYLRTPTGFFVLHVSVSISNESTRLELIAAETDQTFSGKRYDRIEPFKKGFLLIKSNRPEWYIQKKEEQNKYRRQIISQLKTQERMVYSDSTIEETQHLLYEPRRLLLHYDGTKLTIKQWLTE